MMAQCHIYRTDTSSIKDELQAYLSSGFLCDFKVICGNTTYNIHKLVAAVACPQLWNIFEEECEIGVLNLSTFDENEVNHFISALYQLDDNSSILEYSNILRNLNISDSTITSNLHFPLESKTPNILSIEFEGAKKEVLEKLDKEESFVPAFKKRRGKYNKNGKKKFRFKCDMCNDYSSESLLELRNHKKVDHDKVFQHNIKNSFSCDLCGEHCGGQRSLRYHIKFSCTKCLIPCSYCPRKLKNKRTATRHISKEHSGLENVYKSEKISCEVCAKQIFRNRLKYHMETHDPNSEKWDCSDCGKKFIRIVHLKRHRCGKVNSFGFKDNEGNMLCTLCLVQFKTQTLKEVNQHQKEKHMENNEVLSKTEYSCPVPDCGVKKHQVNQIKVHLQTNHFKVLKISCGICPQKFSHSNAMKKHRSKVHQVKPPEFQCDHCGDDFFEPYKLKDHIYLAHSEERRFQCKYCSKAFKRSSELGRHLFVHEAHLSKFECHICGKRCRDKSTLNAHTSTHTKKKLSVSVKEAEYNCIFGANEEKMETVIRKLEQRYQEKKNLIK